MKPILTLGTLAVLTLTAGGAFAEDIKIFSNTDTGVSAEQMAEAGVDGEIVVENDVTTETDAGADVLIEGTVDENAETMVLEENDEIRERIQEIEGLSEVGTDVEAAKVVEIE